MTLRRFRSKPLQVQVLTFGHCVLLSRQMQSSELEEAVHVPCCCGSTEVYVFVCRYRSVHILKYRTRYCDT
jgi:hypothetical protein